ncbi:hypothetical protein GUJ93_ZPchr0003g17683 [Zizania palustris]|uniref:DUF1677 family protein n=1 Tax=Zizania palustris TaxID=103762 RepID=A0A8J5S2Y2_ZIZPA|nr:hypothetical protein GUJ93_ZPchr0003g17683 [Zizania palustris]
MEAGEVEDAEEGAVVVEAVACECCGFTQECTAPYMAGVRARYGGRWICGLCGDAVGEELVRALPPISPGEALDRHAAVCRARRASAPDEHAGDIIAAVRVLLLRRLGSSPPRTPPRRVRSTPSSPRRAADSDSAGVSGVTLARTGSCFAALLE